MDFKRLCQQCSGPMPRLARKDAQTCSPACKQALYRKRNDKQRASDSAYAHIDAELRPIVSGLFEVQKRLQAMADAGELPPCDRETWDYPASFVELAIMLAEARYPHLAVGQIIFRPWDDYAGALATHRVEIEIMLALLEDGPMVPAEHPHLFWEHFEDASSFDLYLTELVGRWGAGVELDNLPLQIVQPRPTWLAPDLRKSASLPARAYLAFIKEAERIGFEIKARREFLSTAYWPAPQR
jgi:hypothetical protein